MRLLAFVASLALVLWTSTALAGSADVRLYGSQDPNTEAAAPSRADALFAVAVKLGRPWNDQEPSADRELRLRMVALAITTATDDAVAEGDWPMGEELELDALSLTLAWFESWRFARWVHLGGARKDSIGYAISLWSLHAWRLVPYSEWKTLGGLDGTARSAGAAARVLTWARGFCKGAKWPDGAIALYATGKRCYWSGAYQRARVFRRVLADLRVVLAGGGRSSPSWAPLPAGVIVAARRRDLAHHTLPRPTKPRNETVML